MPSDIGRSTTAWRSREYIAPELFFSLWPWPDLDRVACLPALSLHLGIGRAQRILIFVQCQQTRFNKLPRKPDSPDAPARARARAESRLRGQPRAQGSCKNEASLQRISVLKLCFALACAGSVVATCPASRVSVMGLQPQTPLEPCSSGPTNTAARPRSWSRPDVDPGPFMFFFCSLLEEKCSFASC